MEKIWTPKDGTIDILSDGDKKYVEVKSKMGYPAIYPLHDIKISTAQASNPRLFGYGLFSLRSQDLPATQNLNLTIRIFPLYRDSA